MLELNHVKYMDIIYAQLVMPITITDHTNRLPNIEFMYLAAFIYFCQ